MNGSSSVDKLQPDVSGRTRSILSLLIFLHLFCVIQALLANQFGSLLQLRIAHAIAPYTRLLNFAPSHAAGFHLTHAMESEDDHFLEIERSGGQVIRIPDPNLSTTLAAYLGGYRRLRMLAMRFSAFLAEEDDESTAELTRVIGRHFLSRLNDDRIVLRCIRRSPLELMRESETAPNRLATIYEADIWADQDGQIRIHKRVAKGEAAPIAPGKKANP